MNFIPIALKRTSGIRTSGDRTSWGPPVLKKETN